MTCGGAQRAGFLGTRPSFTICKALCWNLHILPRHALLESESGLYLSSVHWRGHGMRLNQETAEQPEGEIVTFKARMTNTVLTAPLDSGILRRR